MFRQSYNRAMQRIRAAPRRGGRDYAENQSSDYDNNYNDNRAGYDQNWSEELVNVFLRQNRQNENQESENRRGNSSEIMAILNRVRREPLV